MPAPWSADPGSHPPMGSGAPVLDAPPTYGTGPAGPIGPRPPAGPTPPRPSGPRGWMAAVAVLAVALVVALVALGLSRRSTDVAATDPAPTTTTPDSSSTTVPGGAGGSGGNPTPGDPTPGNPTPSTTAPVSTSGLPTGPAPSAAEVQALVDELVPFVEAQRGAAFIVRPTVTVVADADFAEALGRVLEPGDASVQRRGALLQAMTVVSNSVDLVDARNQILANETVVLYDSTGPALLVRALPITDYTRAQVVGQLTRALDDQVVDGGIVRPAYATERRELAFTLAAVVDGDAARVTDAWLATLPADRRQAYDALVGQVRAKSRPAGLNQAIVDLIDGPATVGGPFVGQLLATAPDRLAAALVTPPVASALVLHPQGYLDGERPTDVPVPDAGGEVVDRGVFGEQLTAVVLADVLEPAAARAAADGWAGDSYSLWRSGGTGSCVTIHYVLRDITEARELAQAFTQWARSRGGVEVDEGNGRRPELLVTSCGGAASGRSPW